MACFLCFPLLCTETGTHSAFLLAGFGVLQYIDKVVDVGDAVALWRLCERISHFLRVRAVCLESGLFPRALCSGSHLPLCAATVHGSFWTNFFCFLREKWTLSFLRSSHPTLFLRAISGSSACVSQHCFWKNFSYFHRDAQFELENLDYFSCSHVAVGCGFDAFFALLRVVPELSASFLEPSMAKSSLPSRAHHAN